MGSTSLGKQRADRRSHRNGAVCRFLAALGASIILGFGVGAPIAAAQTRSVPRHGGGGGRSDETERLRVQVDRLVDRVRAERRQHEQRTQTETQLPAIQTPPVTPPVVQPSPPRPVSPPPVVVPSIIGTVPVGATAPATVTARPPGAPPGTPAGAAAASGAPAAVSPQGVVPTPPAAAPRTAPRSAVARALRTARSYSVLLALAAAVLAFLMIQGRVDRRDPRILGAPAEDRLPFRDFE
ncbi:MAG TPA: hypothetical protein VLV81_00780 [Acidimicrobiia bacterium]|nr:hypothetical protein [Acidimicrobiia bacterium]